MNIEQKKWVTITAMMTMREMYILMMRHIMKMTYEEISRNLEITVERVRQLETIALKKITLHSKKYASS